MVRFPHLLLAGLLCLWVAAAHAADPVQPIAARPTSEAWGDELDAKGQYREAFSQYRSQWSAWQIMARAEAARGGTTQETQDHLERLTRKLAGSLDKFKPLPAVPESAIFSAQKGIALFKLARDKRDFQSAAQQFEAALWTAPWVGDYHYNLAKCQKSAGQLAAALKTLRLADILAREQQDRRDVMALRAEVEAMSEIENRKR